MDYIGRALVADALREWREQLQDRASVSPLRDLIATQASLVDIRAGHPSGLAQLFANRPTAISSLLRDPHVRAAGLHRGRLILAEAERVRAATGAWTAAMVVGTVAWTEDGNRVEMPLVMRPVGLEPHRTDDVQVILYDQVHVNPVFATLVRERAAQAGTNPSLPALTGGRDFDPRPLWEHVRGLKGLFGDDLEVLDRLLLGAFDDPEQRLLDDLDDCDPVISGSTVLAAAAGDHDARAQLGEPLPAFPRGDRDPFAERGIGELDDVQFAALDLIATGRDVFLQAPPGADVVGTAAAIAADGAASGKTVAVVGGQERSLKAITARLRELGAGDLAIDGTQTAWNADARARLLESITMGTPHVDDDSLRTAGETLLRARGDLHRRFDALHRSHRPWGVSVFEAVQAIVRLTTSEITPSTSLRLSPDAGAVVAEHGFASVAAAIVEVLRPAEGTEPEQTAPEEPIASSTESWWAEHAEPEQGGRLDEALATLLGRAVPKMRAEAAIASHETGVDEATSMAVWFEQVRMFEALREVLEVFSPAVFHRSLHDLVAATAPHGSSRYIDLPRRERRAMLRRAVELLRPGRGKETLHEDLVRAHDLALQWRAQCSAGGWPTVPDDYDVFADRVADATRMWDVLAPTLHLVVEDDDLAAVPWDEMVSELDRLAQGLPGGTLDSAAASPIDIDPVAAGLGPLIEELRERDASDAQVRRDLEFAWWAAAFDAIVRADTSLTEYGALGTAVEHFRASDATFSRARVGPLMRAAAERRRSAITRHPDLARDLFAALVEGADASIKELWRDFGPLTAALRPVVIAKAEQVSRLAPPARVFDVALVVASESLALAELVPTLARAKQVVVIGDAHAATRSAVSALGELLPHVTLHAAPQGRDVRVTAVLARAAYGRSIEALPAPGDQSRFEVYSVDGVGTPVAGADVVESTRAEVAAVVEHVARAFDSLPRRDLLVVAGNALHAARVREALRERSSRLAASVPVEVMADAAGHAVDEVVITLGFARDSRRAGPARLGVLSEPGGRQALVQALVASRTHVSVYSAVAPTDLPPGGDHGDGIEDLRELLRAGAELPIAPERPEPAPSDWLLADVANRLRFDGFGVHVRYGNGPDAVPMAVGGRHERRYRVAVVTDEAAPAGSASLRDRVRWQRSSLETLGWAVVPLWTLDVFMDPDAAADQVRAALEVRGPAHFQDELEIDIEVPSSEPQERDEPFDLSREGDLASVDEPAEVHSALRVDPAPMPAAEPAPQHTDTADARVESAGQVEVAGMLEFDAVEDAATAAEEPHTSAESGREDAEAASEREVEPEPEPRVPALGFGVPKLAVPAKKTTQRPSTSKDRTRGTDRPLIPTRASEDRDEGWGGGNYADAREEEIKRERPPHW